MILPLNCVLCMAETEAHLAAVLAVGSKALWVENALTSILLNKLPSKIQKWVTTVTDLTTGRAEFDAVLHHGPSGQLRQVCERVSVHPGAISAFTACLLEIEIYRLKDWSSSLLSAVNTAAAGGNASLMTIG